MYGNILVLNVDFFAFWGGFGHHLGSSFSFKNRPKFKVLPLGRSKSHQKSLKMRKKSILGRVLDASFSEAGLKIADSQVDSYFLAILSTADHIVDSYFSQCHQVRSIWDKF